MPNSPLKILGLLFPVLEIALFIFVASLIGFWYTVLMVLGTTALGIFLVRHHGMRGLERMVQQQGTAKFQGIVSAPVAMTAGLLLIIPGFITDFFGLLVLIPGARRLFMGLMVKKKPGRPGETSTSSSKGQEESGFHTIEGEYWSDDEKKEP